MQKNQKTNGSAKVDGAQAASQKMAVVPVPLELYSDMLEILQRLPYNKVGKLMNKLSHLRPTEVTVQEIS